MKEQITYNIFDKVDIRVGTVISVEKNEKARKPSLVVEVDFGEEIGVKQSSAQITHYYNEENLKGKQVIGVCNFAEKNIAGVVSQVLILGSIDNEGKVIFGSTVYLENLDTGEKINYKIVGKDEADLKLKLIYFQSPIGKGLIGKNKKELVEITTPAGVKNFEIKDVKYI